MKLSRYRTAAIDLACLIGGSVLYAVSVVMFSAPNRIAPGGVTGLATLAQYLWGLPIGTVTVLLNLPLLLVGWRRLGRAPARPSASPPAPAAQGLGARIAAHPGNQFLGRTLIGIALSSLATDLLDPLLPAYRGDTLLVCLFGGALSGLALGLILLRGGTTGGSEIAARLIEQKFPHIPIGKLVLAVDAVVIALAGAVYREIDSVLYATVYAFVCSLVTDRLVYGGRRGKLALVATAHPREVADRIIRDIGRGVTLLHADGGYTGREGRLLLCAVRGEETYALRELVFSCDEGAFFMMLSTDEVRGIGFLDPKMR